MAYQANIDITVGEKKYHSGDEIDKIGDVAVRWLLQEGYISELAKEKAAEKESAASDKKQSKRKSDGEKLAEK